MMLTSALVIACSREENPYRREFDGLFHEIRILKDQVATQEKEAATAKQFASLLQEQNVKLVQDGLVKDQVIESLQSDKAGLVAELAVASERHKNAEYQLTQLMAQQQTIQKQREDEKRQEEVTRQQQIAAIAVANKKSVWPPFAVYDVMYIGDKADDGTSGEVGRISVKNYTSQSLDISVSGRWINIPPNEAQEAIYLPASKGRPFKVNGAGHTVTLNWE